MAVASRGSAACSTAVSIATRFWAAELNAGNPENAIKKSAFIARKHQHTAVF